MSGGDDQLSGLPPEEASEVDDRSRSDRERTRLYFRLSALLFLGGGIAAVPPNLLLLSEESAVIFVLPVLGVASAIVTWAISDFAPRSWLHGVAVIATLEVALAVALASPIYAVYYTFIAVFAAYAFEDRRAIAAHVGFLILLTLAPIIYDSGSARELSIQALVLIPTLIIASGMVTYLREQLGASEKRYRDLSERDPLTGIGNYRMLVNRVPHEIRRHARYARPMAVIVLDLDDFKRVNDVMGHQRGDHLLQEVAGELVISVRAHDIVVRQGGDEFAVIAPETDIGEATRLAARLRERLSALAADGHRIGATIGCAHYPADAETLEGLLGIADERLRAAKGQAPVGQRRRDEATQAPSHGVAPANTRGPAPADPLK